MLNNIAWTFTGAGVLAYNAPFMGKAAVAATNEWSNNISFGANNNFSAPDVFSASLNKVSVNPLLVNPASANFALQAGSPAINYGTARSSLPLLEPDAGACPKAFATCP